MRKHVCILVCSLIFIQCAQDGGADNDTGGPRPKPGAVPIRTQAEIYLLGKWEFENEYLTFVDEDDMDPNTWVELRNKAIEQRKNSYLEFYEDGKYLFLMNDQSGFAIAGDFNVHKDSLTFHYKNDKGIDTMQTWNVEILNEKRLVLDKVYPETWRPYKYSSITYVKTNTEEQ